MPDAPDDPFFPQVRARLLSERVAGGWWEGELSSSSLSTATAIVALHLVDPAANEEWISRGQAWLLQHQNGDGGWGDTPKSKSNLSTSLLVWSALGLIPPPTDSTSLEQVEGYITAQVGSLEPSAILRSVVGRYGKDKTFSVPILMMAAIGGRLGPAGWKRVLPLPFELAALPREWFGAIGLPVVSYALPALIAIGHARFFHVPPSRWNPLRWLRGFLWPKIRPMLRLLQPSTGGYLEATPLTSFVTMALAASGEKEHPCVPDAVRFLRASMREDGSWPIDTNLATWGTTLAVKALQGDFDSAAEVKAWLLGQQYEAVHPFTNAPPGGWAWTDLPGGVPDADDTSGALVALSVLCPSAEERREVLPRIEAGVTWLLDLQNRDGGVPTFCRGWGTLPFDRSTPEITAHAIWAWSCWHDELSPATQARIVAGKARALHYLRRAKHPSGDCWEPLWFGNEHAPGEINLVYGTAQVLHYLKQSGLTDPLVSAAEGWLVQAQNSDGSWGIKGSIEETAVAIAALEGHPCTARGLDWLKQQTRDGTDFPASPIGLYFARLWYHERLYPMVWTLGTERRGE
jgi:squalene-hopene/tetraprenyl-beta-curcumene cyclase